MAMMKSLPVFSLCDTLALHLQSVMRCFSASSVHAMIMAEANQSVYFVTVGVLFWLNAVAAAVC